jgi:hypothetical protein
MKNLVIIKLCMFIISSWLIYGVDCAFQDQNNDDVTTIDESEFGSDIYSAHSTEYSNTDISETMIGADHEDRSVELKFPEPWEKADPRREPGYDDLEHWAKSRVVEEYAKRAEKLIFLSNGYCEKLALILHIATKKHLAWRRAVSICRDQNFYDVVKSFAKFLDLESRYGADAAHTVYLYSAEIFRRIRKNIEPINPLLELNLRVAEFVQIFETLRPGTNRVNLIMITKELSTLSFLMQVFITKYHMPMQMWYKLFFIGIAPQLSYAYGYLAQTYAILDKEGRFDEALSITHVCSGMTQKDWKLADGLVARQTIYNSGREATTLDLDPSEWEENLSRMPRIFHHFAAKSPLKKQ